MKIRDRSTLSLFDSRHSNADRAPLTLWIDPDEPDADNFAGGGGARLGIKRAYERLGIERRAPGIAVNHWPEALAMYAANHPECRVFCEDILKVDPAAASGGRRIVYAHFSPTCIFFSQAAGAALDAEEATKVRGLAGLAIVWAESPAKPRVISLENVKQFMQWGPLHRQHTNGCSTETAISRGTVTRKGKVKPKCLKGCCYGRPIKARRGEFFRAFVEDLRKHYRYVSWRVLKACDYGSPTSRERFFLIASDKPARWPDPTHGPGRAKPWRTAAECIDWSIECPSIFERAKPLADKTLARIRAGIERFVFDATRPFVVRTAMHMSNSLGAHSVDEPLRTITTDGGIGVVQPYLVPTSYGDKGGTDVRVSSVDEPARTICGNRSGLNVVSPLVMKAKTYGGGGGNDARPANVQLGTIMTSKRGEHAIATPYLVHRSNGERGATETTKAQAPRVYDAQKPLTTIMAQGAKHGAVMPVLVKNYSEREGGFAGGQPIDKPASTITQRDHHAIAALNLLKLRGTSEAHVEASAHPLDEPTPTIAAQGTHIALTAAYLIRYNGTSGPESLAKPLSTIDTRDRFALVTLEMERDVNERALRVAAFLGYDAPIVLEIDGVQWVLVDIGFRMLTPPELFRCQGFPPSYKIDVVFNGKPLSKTAQIKCVGNSVPPQLAEAVAIAAIQTIEYEPQHARAA